MEEKDKQHQSKWKPWNRSTLSCLFQPPPQFVSLRWNAKRQSAWRAEITPTLKWQRRAGRQETAGLLMTCAENRSPGMNWKHLKVKSVPNPADVRVPRGAAGGLEVWKWIWLRSGRQKSPNQSVRGDLSSDKQTQLIYNSWRVSKRLGVPVDRSVREGFFFPRVRSSQSALRIQKSVWHMDARCRLSGTEEWSAVSLSLSLSTAEESTGFFSSFSGIKADLWCRSAPQSQKVLPPLWNPGPPPASRPFQNLLQILQILSGPPFKTSLQPSSSSSRTPVVIWSFQ